MTPFSAGYLILKTNCGTESELVSILCSIVFENTRVKTFIVVSNTFEQRVNTV